MADIVMLLCTLSIFVVCWMFTAFMVDLTLTKKFSAARTTAYWIFLLLLVLAACSILLLLYRTLVPVTTAGYGDLLGVVADYMLVTIVSIGLLVGSRQIYQGAASATLFVSSLYMLISLYCSNLAVNLVSIWLPAELYHQEIYYLAQSALMFVMLTIVLALVILRIGQDIRGFIHEVQGFMHRFLLIPLILYVTYIAINCMWNFQTAGVSVVSGVITSTIFLIFCIILYTVIIYGVRVSVKTARIEEELRIAHVLQNEILPSEKELEQYPGVEIAASMSPCSEVSGDFYDVFPIGKHHLVVMIVDVAGKGVPAALVMMRVQTLVRITIRDFHLPGEALTLINKNLLINNDSCIFITGILGLINIVTGEFIYSIAGHAPPILCKNGEVEVLSKTNDPVLGIREHIYTDARITLTKNDTVFIYTDGITDAADRKGRYYGTERLLSVLRKSDGPQTALDMVTEDLKNFTGDEKQMDDMTLLAFRLLPKGE